MTIDLYAYLDFLRESNRELLKALSDLVACDLWQDRPEMQQAKEAIRKAKGEL